MSRHTDKRQNASDPTTPHQPELFSAPQRTRRSLLSLLRTGVGAIAASTGVAALLKNTSGTALARPLDTVGNFSSSLPGTPAITAIATNSAPGIYVESYNSSGHQHGFGVSAITDVGTVYVAQSTSGDGIYAETQSGDAIYGTSDTGSGAVGISNSGIGVYGSSNSGVGVYGVSDSDTAGFFYSSSGEGIFSYSNNNNGIFAFGAPYAAALYGMYM
ncbi:hypothetical protein [Dictyobacter kobayashii]|uniref:Uncharacterized protein n=1 Tax=Dictyobacter kobayashii TaxID=2014872 RepID=A0A402AYJ5_9CHLR|nr:hypothetical protein [Dictyobacter kobayashii]GCE24164.1 hypothetical protein KDK_79640 [Dictyobacter kobayashii]